MDAIDNRNLETLVRTWNEYPKVKDLGPSPRDWWPPQQRMVLAAMRAAGDQALFDSVTVRLDRSFGTPPPELDRLRAAAQLARTALDGLMGDSDLPDDDSPEMKAMQALSAVLPDPA